MPDGGKTSRQKWWGLTFGTCRLCGSHLSHSFQMEKKQKKQKEEKAARALV